MTRAAVVLGALSFLRSVGVGGVVVVFLAMSGAVSGRATAAIGVGVVVVAAVLALGTVALARRS